MTHRSPSEPERKPTLDECHDAGAPILVRLLDKAYGVGQWRAAEPGELDTVQERKAS